MYSIYIYNPKSNAITKIIKLTKKISPNFNKTFWTRVDKGLLKTA